MSDLKKMYTTILGDSFPMEMTLSFGDQTLVYRKRTWAISTEDGGVDERGIRYGENPDQEAALYELINGNLVLGDCKFIEPGNSLVSGISVEDMLQVGKHPGKINLTDVDNGLNIIKYLVDKPAAVILKHNNPCGAAVGANLADAYNKANRADRIAAFGGAVITSQAIDKATAEAYWKRNVNLITVLLIIWALVSYVAAIFLAQPLYGIKLEQLPLSFWFAQQGSIYVFLVLIFVYAASMNRLDKKYDVDEA